MRVIPINVLVQRFGDIYTDVQLESIARQYSACTRAERVADATENMKKMSGNYSS